MTPECKRFNTLIMNESPYLTINFLKIKINKNLLWVNDSQKWKVFSLPMNNWRMVRLGFKSSTSWRVRTCFDNCSILRPLVSYTTACRNSTAPGDWMCIFYRNSSPWTALLDRSLVRILRTTGEKRNKQISIIWSYRKVDIRKILILFISNIHL